MKSFDPYSIIIALNHLSDLVESASITNYWKDYVMPIIVVALSSLTAYLIAIKGFQFQEQYKNEKNKADNLNALILQMQSMHTSLIGIKQNYHKDLTSHPIQRALNLPLIPLKIEPVSFKLSDLAQLLYAKGADLDKSPWMNINSYLVTSSNYNMFIDMLALRNQLDDEVKRQLAPLLLHSSDDGEIKISDVFETIENVLLMRYLDLTENFVMMVDDLLITINDFLTNFPSQANKLIKKKFLKGYIFINSYENDSDTYKELVTRCKKVDLNLMAEVMKFDKEQAKKKYVQNSITIVTPKV
ncbi:hypothetical protein ACWKSU_17705 [Enterobacter cloacae]